MTEQLRVIVADDSSLFRRMLVECLRVRGVDVLGEAADLPGTLALVDRLRPDVAVLDVRMPPSGTDEGVVAAERIREQGPAVLLLSQHVETRTAVDLLKQGGGVGYLFKDRVADTDELLDQLRRLAAGGVVLDADVVARLMGTNGSSDRLAALSNAERTVLAMVAEGHSNAAIADRLFVSERTVEDHVSATFRKLHLDNTAEVNRRVQAVLIYLESRG